MRALRDRRRQAWHAPVSDSAVVSDEVITTRARMLQESA